MARSGGGADRRKTTGDFRVRPPSSPASLLVLTVAAVLLATAAATALLGDGYSDRTPHGRLLGALQEMAEAQESFYERTGRFAGWQDGLRLREGTTIELVTVRAGDASWEAVVQATDAGLTCRQSGRIAPDGRAVRDRATCYTMGE